MSTPQGASRFGGNSNPQSAPASTGAGGSNVFTRKIGPLPLWGWMGIGLAVALVFYFWKQNKQKAAASSTGQSITPPGTGADQTRSASQIPQFVNLTNVQNAQSQQQNTTKTSTQPPAAPPPPPAPSTSIPAWVGTLKGMTAAQAVSTIQQNGWVVNSTTLQGISGVRFAQGVDPNKFSNYTVTGTQGYVNGMAGHNFANSVDLVINNPGSPT